MKLMDCTLRDGGNVVGKGFDAELTKMMMEGLIASNITLIEREIVWELGLMKQQTPLHPVRMKNI